MLYLNLTKLLSLLQELSLPYSNVLMIVFYTSTEKTPFGADLWPTGHRGSFSA